MRAADDTSDPGVPERLDAWLAGPVVRTRHSRRSALAPAKLWEAAGRVRLEDTRRLGRLVRWRIPDLPSGLTYDGLFRAYPFTVIEEGEWFLLAGLCGRIWTLSRDYPRLGGPDEFAAWDEPGTVRVLFGHWVEPGPDGSSRLVSEARVAPVDRTAALRLRALWAVVGPFERLVGAEAIAAATGRSSRA
jgi:hypothetical protein